MPTIAENAEEIKRRIGELNLEHRDLDRAIEALELNPLHDELQLKRLKKRKLQLRDRDVIQAGVLVIASGFVIINLVVDLLYATVDPRIRHS